MLPASAALALPSEQDPPPKPSSYIFFSGRVCKFNNETIHVARNLASRKPEIRCFIRTQETVIKGTLAKDAHVTVAYTNNNGVLIAQRILIRE